MQYARTLIAHDYTHGEFSFETITHNKTPLNESHHTYKRSHIIRYANLCILNQILIIKWEHIYNSGIVYFIGFHSFEKVTNLVTPFDCSLLTIRFLCSKMMWNLYIIFNVVCKRNIKFHQFFLLN